MVLGPHLAHPQYLLEPQGQGESRVPHTRKQHVARAIESKGQNGHISGES